MDDLFQALVATGPGTHTNARPQSDTPTPQGSAFGAAFDALVKDDAAPAGEEVELPDDALARQPPGGDAMSEVEGDALPQPQRASPADIAINAQYADTAPDVASGSVLMPVSRHDRQILPVAPDVADQQDFDRHASGSSMLHDHHQVPDGPQSPDRPSTLPPASQIDSDEPGLTQRPQVLPGAEPTQPLVTTVADQTRPQVLPAAPDILPKRADPLAPLVLPPAPQKDAPTLPTGTPIGTPTQPSTIPPAPVVAPIPRPQTIPPAQDNPGPTHATLLPVADPKQPLTIPVSEQTTPRPQPQTIPPAPMQVGNPEARTTSPVAPFAQVAPARATPEVSTPASRMAEAPAAPRTDAGAALPQAPVASNSALQSAAASVAPAAPKLTAAANGVAPPESKADAAIEGGDDPRTQVPLRTGSWTIPAPSTTAPFVQAPVSSATPAFATPLTVAGTPEAMSDMLSDLDIGLQATLSPVSSTALTPTTSLLAHAPSATAQVIAQQIATALSNTSKASDAPLELALDPPELGRVRMQMAEIAGVMTLTIHAERPETADLMRRHLDLLAQEFAQAGLDAPSVRISQDGAGQGGGDDRAPPQEGAPSAAQNDGASETLAPLSPRTASGGLDLRL